MPDGLGGPRVLADGPAAQAPARPEQDDLEGDRDDDQGDRRAVPGRGTSRPATPMPGRLVNASGGVQALNWPAPSGELSDSSEIR